MDYTIFNFSTNATLLKNEKLKLTFDYYNNRSDYSTYINIPNEMKNEREGFSTSFSYGQLKNKKYWLVQLTYANLESFDVVHYFAQNDWVRWDYSSIGCPYGRISNFHGIRFTGGYAIHKNFVLKLNYYKVEQLKAISGIKETGDRILLDLDIKF
jgi:hypothetical protein